MKIELSEPQSRKKWLLATGLVLLVGYAFYLVFSKPIKEVPLDQLSFAKVEQGALDIYASSYGEFASKRERLLTAPALGKVAEILVRPGSRVTGDTIILRLSNPKLIQQVNEARGQLAQQQAQRQAQRQAFKYEQHNERLNYQGRIADIEANVEKAELEQSVHQNLVKLGVSSKIELQRAQLALKQESKRLSFEQRKYKQFLEMQSYQLTQREIVITQQQSQIALLEQQQQDMAVKAGINGSLQMLNVELGQSVQLGQSLARVGSDKDLIARLRLPQREADQIDINAPVIIDTQKGLIRGHISRIESLVTNGSVLAEAVLDSPLTSNARPALPISARVFIKNEPTAIYVDQIAGMRPHSSQTVFVRTGKSTLEQRNITFGELTSNKLTIIKGLAANEQVVSSNTSSFEQYSTVSLTQ